MNISLIGLLAIIFTFGAAILAHEFGHFIVAKILGVGVETFSIGMGKKLIKIKRGETTYCLSAIPFGGYVVLKGAMSSEMESMLRADEGGQKQDGPAPQAAAEAEKEPPRKSLAEMATEDIVNLRNRPLWVKIAIFLAGVTFNYIVAFTTFALILIVGIRVPRPKPPVVGYIAPETVAAQMGIQSGDMIVRAGGRDVEHFEDFYKRLDEMIRSEATTMTLAMRHGDSDYEVSLPVSKQSPELKGFLENFGPPMNAFVESVSYNQPAEKAGIRPGDEIIGINSEEITDWMKMVSIVKKSAGKPLDIRIRRGEEILTVSAIPDERPNEPGVGILGVTRGEPDTIVERTRPIQAFRESYRISIQIMGFVAQNTYNLFRRFNLREIGENMGGPVAIAIESYRQAKSGFENYFYFFGAFNIMLMMLNILPLPILDGGHIMLSIIESIFRKPVSARVLIRIYTVMAILLITLALLVTFNDIIRNLWRLGLGS